MCMRLHAHFQQRSRLLGVKPRASWLMAVITASYLFQCNNKTVRPGPVIRYLPYAKTRWGWLPVTRVLFSSFDWAELPNHATYRGSESVHGCRCCHAIWRQGCSLDYMFDGALRKCQVVMINGRSCDFIAEFACSLHIVHEGNSPKEFAKCKKILQIQLEIIFLPTLKNWDMLSVFSHSVSHKQSTMEYFAKITVWKTGVLIA